MRKIPTLFLRDQSDRRYVTQAVTPSCEWVLAGEGLATRKWDGTCVRVDDDGNGWARREVKRGAAPPPNFVGIERDETTGKTVGWEPIEQSGFAKFYREAAGHAFDGRPSVGTYELCGPKINGNPDGFSRHILVAHGVAHLIPELFARDWHAIRLYLDVRDIEGIVFWRGGPDDDMAKIKRRDFRR